MDVVESRVVESRVVESHAVESLAVKSRVAQKTAGLTREMEIGMPAWSEERCRDADSRPRFIAVHFPRWVIDLEVALLRRAMARCSRADHKEIAVDASPSINAPGFLAGIDLPLIVVREHHRVQHVVGICPLAYAAGVRVGMTMAQAEAMCSGGSAACQAPASAGPKGDAIARRAWRWRQLQILVGHAHPSCGTVADAPSPKALGGIPWRERIVSLTGDMMAVAWSAVVARRAIERLAQCLQRWIPIVAIDTTGCADTLVGDLTGCATLYRRRFRTEQALLQRIGSSLMRRGVRPRLATASTVGAAMAMARSAHAAVSTDADAVQHVAIPDGRELAYLSPLPISSLRLDAASVEALRSVEVSTIGQLAALGRQGVASRLSGGPCAEALGRADPRSSVGKLGGARARCVGATRSGAWPFGGEGGVVLGGSGHRRWRWPRAAAGADSLDAAARLRESDRPPRGTDACLRSAARAASRGTAAASPGPPCRHMDLPSSGRARRHIDGRNAGKPWRRKPWRREPCHDVHHAPRPPEPAWNASVVDPSLKAGARAARPCDRVGRVPNRPCVTAA